ncbi:MAG: cytochrome P450 [Bacteroidota bacterium]
MPTPHVPRALILRNLLRLARHPLVVFQEYIERYGQNFVLAVGGSRSTHFTTDAEVARHVLQRNHRNYEKSEIQTVEMGKYLGFGLLTNGGESWLCQRRLIQPGFHRQRLERIVADMQTVITDHCAAAAGREAVDLKAFTKNAAFAIIVRAIFTDGFDAAATAELQRILDHLQAYVIYPIRLPFLKKPLRWFGFDRKYLRLAAVARAMIMERITARREGAPGDDLLQMLLDSRYEDGTSMTDEQLLDEIVILFAAGYETSANALAWAVHLLLRHPEHLPRIQEEIAATGPLGFHNAGQLTYLTQVIEETMRLYPPAWITDRVGNTDDEVAGHHIPKGRTVGIYIYGIHRSAAYYDDPEAFRPARMHPDRKKARPPFSYLPFGGGPRLCIGNHFAMLEMQLLLAELLGKYDVAAVSNTEHIPAVPTITLGMGRKVSVCVTPAQLMG